MKQERGERERRKEKIWMTTSASRCRRHLCVFGLAMQSVCPKKKTKWSTCVVVQNDPEGRKHQASHVVCGCGNQAATSLVVVIIFKALTTANVCVRSILSVCGRVFACRCRDASNCVLTPMNGQLSLNFRRP